MVFSYLLRTNASASILISGFKSIPRCLVFWAQGNPLDAKVGFYLYPESGGADDLKLRMNRGSTYEGNVSARDDVSITKHGLKIPVGAPNYNSFIMDMEIAEQEFMHAFSTNAVYEMTNV